MKKIITILGICGAFQANAICFEPTEPSCVNFGFNSQGDFDYCKLQVKRYLQDLEEYRQCVINETAEAAQKVIRKFNCYASGERVCY